MKNAAPDRADPFGMGIAAYRASRVRGQCPFPAVHVEGRTWLAGWDHAQRSAGAPLPGER